MADAILTQAEETLLREFRDQLALSPNTVDTQAAAQLGQATTDRLILDARFAALAFDNAGTHLHDLSTAIRDAGMTPAEGNDLLTHAWEAAVEGVLEDGLLTFDEETALNRYVDHFNLDRNQLDRNEVPPHMVKSGALRDITEGIVPDRPNVAGRVPFNLMREGESARQDVDAELLADGAGAAEGGGLRQRAAVAHAAAAGHAGGRTQQGTGVPGVMFINL